MAKEQSTIRSAGDDGNIYKCPICQSVLPNAQVASFHFAPSGVGWSIYPVGWTANTAFPGRWTRSIRWKNPLKSQKKWTGRATMADQRSRRIEFGRPWRAGSPVWRLARK